MSKFLLTPGWYWSPAFAGGQDRSSVPSRSLAPFDLANYLKGGGTGGQHSTSLANVTVITWAHKTALVTSVKFSPVAQDRRVVVG
jgi:hypothetical protein